MVQQMEAEGRPSFEKGEEKLYNYVVILHDGVRVESLSNKERKKWTY